MLRVLSTFDEVQERYHWFDHMRLEQPVWFDETSGNWHVFRYRDISGVITDYKTFSSQGSRGDLPSDSTVSRSLLSMDPPEHRHYRDLVSSSFTPRGLAERLSGRITTIVQDLLHRVRPSGEMDFMADLAYPLPVTVITELPGIPPEDRPQLGEWIQILFSSQFSNPAGFSPEGASSLATPNRSFQELSAYFTQQLEERRRQPQNDLMSELVASEIDGERLSLADLISFCLLLFIAGHETTMNLLSQAILCFTDHPEVMHQLRAHPEVMPGAIEEVLRYRSPIWSVSRVTTREVSLAGTSLPPGSKVVAWLASGNRDPALFPDPERFDITRNPNRHLAFSHGIHFCLGAPLARLEASLALPLVLDQLPQLQVVRAKPLELRKNSFLFGVQRLPVTFTASQ